MSERSWRDLIRQHTRECTFSPPATESQLAAAERALGVSLPTDLRALRARFVEMHSKRREA